MFAGEKRARSLRLSLRKHSELLDLALDQFCLFGNFCGAAGLLQFQFQERHGAC